MTKTVLILLLNITSFLGGSSNNHKLCGALSSWGSEQVQLINCPLECFKGTVVGFVRLGCKVPNEIAENVPGLLRFDPINIAHYFRLNLGKVMQDIKRSKKPHLNYALCFQALHTLEKKYEQDARSCRSMQSIEAMQLSFFIDNTLSVIYTCNQKDSKKLFPPIQLIEYFPRIIEIQTQILMLTGDCINKSDGKCDVHIYPSSDHAFISLFVPKKLRRPQEIVDQDLEEVLKKKGRPFAGKEHSKALIVVLHGLSKYDHNLKTVEADDTCGIL